MRLEGRVQLYRNDKLKLVIIYVSESGRKIARPEGEAFKCFG